MYWAEKEGINNEIVQHRYKNTPPTLNVSSSCFMYPPLPVLNHFDDLLVYFDQQQCFISLSVPLITLSNSRYVMWEQSCSLIYSASWTQIEALNVEVSSQESVSHFLKTLERRTSELFRSQLLKLVFCSCIWPLSSTLPSSAYLSLLLLLLPLICPPHYFLFLLVTHFSVRLLDWTQEIFFVSSYLSHADFFLLLISLFMLHTL